MRQLIVFTKKEFLELLRTGKIWIILMIFILFGITNPAFAKLTPWMYEMLSDSMAEGGLIVTNIEVDALTSWMQYYKNIFMAVLALTVMFCGILTSEYQKGTLVNMLTKGLDRWKVIVSKSVTLIIVWSLCYWVCFGITYGYNAYFWDNGIASHVGAGAAYIYLFGIWVISLIMLASSAWENSTGVLLLIIVAVILCYIAGMVPDLADFTPIKLLSAGNLVKGDLQLSDFTRSLIVTSGLSIAGFLAACILFNKKKI